MLSIQEKEVIETLSRLLNQQKKQNLQMKKEKEEKVKIARKRNRDHRGRFLPEQLKPLKEEESYSNSDRGRDVRIVKIKGSHNSYEIKEKEVSIVADVLLMVPIVYLIWVWLF
ncbi:hypothetical protein [Priestia endophytica]|uniref:Uncharacterized protein n=1 Tax=Priestia endophytica DSM 13796 TaxID=1121089 RepID=A0A1I6C0B4_9BACI|nr:hypothetical protein [Priestia endophytica]SFQ86628.1 hypothetical protein SAMN02745910_04685 [Priestia endophytica DSM 13796]